MQHEVITIPNSGKLRGSDHLRVCGYKGRPVVFRGDEFPFGSKVVHIPPGAVVDVNRPEFSWLECPIVKVRSYFMKPSYGFFVAAPEGTELGDQVDLGCVDYVPPPMQQTPVARSSDAISILKRIYHRVFG